ncbi:hypothetical protein SNEBB_011345 [Seison nebaliae]|nr:hypothetical protein SNEBB_011345 [Seison nebaliae]
MNEDSAQKTRNTSKVSAVLMQKKENIWKKDEIDSKFSCPTTKIDVENVAKFSTSTKEAKYKMAQDHNANWKNKKRHNDKTHRQNKREQFRFHKRRLPYTNRGQRSRTVENFDEN